MINAQLELPLAEITAFCQRYPIRKLSLFGSVLRDDFGPDSDVDVLIEFEPGASITYLDLAEMQLELEDLLGRHVDLLTPNALSRYFRQKVVDTALALYERE
jgi:uncharacterized protein